MSVSYRSPLLIPAVARHTATVIFIHGLGDTGDGWKFAVENWRLRQRLNGVKFILPHAPNIPITLNGGFRMPGWYDIVSLGNNPDALRRNEDQVGILRSCEYIQGLIKGEIDAGIPANRIVVGGFSQGAAVSLIGGLTSKFKLAGIVVLSGYLALSGQFQSLLPSPEFNKQTPIFMGHGDRDQVVHPALGNKSYEMLKEWGYDVKFKVYPGLEHSADPEEIDDVAEFIGKVLEDEGKSEL